MNQSVSLFKLSLVFLLFFICNLQGQKTIFLEPGSCGNPFTTNKNAENRNGQNGPFLLLRSRLNKRGYSIKLAKHLIGIQDPRAIICFKATPFISNTIKKWPSVPKILFLWEPPSILPGQYNQKLHEPFDMIFTWNEDLVDNKRYFKVFHPRLLPQLVPPVPFSARKFCTMIAGNHTSNHPTELYSARRATIRAFEHNYPHLFDLYGKKGWDKTSWPSWRGSLQDKFETLSRYKFSICYENMNNIKGYISEKIFHCFASNVVPVYWGADNIDDYIPKNCFVDRRDFADDQELIHYLLAVSEVEFNTYLENIKAFITSKAARRFSPEAFIELLFDTLDIS